MFKRATFLKNDLRGYRLSLVTRLILQMAGMQRLVEIPAAPPRGNRYSRALEKAPELLATLEDRKSQELELGSEVGLARMLLEQLLGDLGEGHARNGVLNPIALDGVRSLLQQVHGVVTSAAGIEAKRNDQKISAATILTLLVGLRDELKRKLNMAFGETASQVVEDVFAHARWTGGLRDEDVRDALLEPAAFELKLRQVDREGDALKEAGKAKGLSSPELLALGGTAEEVTKADPLKVPTETVTETTEQEHE